MIMFAAMAAATTAFAATLMLALGIAAPGSTLVPVVVPLAAATAALVAVCLAVLTALPHHGRHQFAIFEL